MGNRGSNMAAGLNLQPKTVNGCLFLDLSNQGLTSIPEEVFDITDLEVLDVSNNKLTSIPEAIGRLQKLERLCANGNKLTSLPQAIGSLQKLTMLLIRDNQLTEVPSGVCSLSNLQVLEAKNNKLSTLPPGVEKLQKLTKLHIHDNQLTEVPPGVCSLSNLEVLDVSNNKLSTLPPGVEKLQKLRELYIQGNQLTEVPPGVCSLPNLDLLNVGLNPIRRLPDDVRRLTRLKTLDVHSCQLEEFPRQVLQLKTLEKLYAGGCKFDTVPDEVGTLQHLWYLSLVNNLLKTLPSTMSHLHNLREVKLWNNKFDTFPEVLCELPAMEKLDISNNNITKLPTALHRADKLTDLDVSENSLTYPPHDVRAQGTHGIMAFLKQEDEKEGAKQAGQEEKGSGAGRVTQRVRDVQVTSVNVAHTADTTETAAETELERKLREGREKTARMQQQVSQHRGQTAEGMDSSRAAAKPKTPGTSSQADVRPKQPAPVPVPVSLKLAGDNTDQDKELLQAFNRLSVKVGQNQWKPIARELGFSSQEIRDIQSVSPDDQMYETLKRWRQRAGPAASLAGLEQSLRNLELHQLADLLTRTPKSTARGGRELEERGAVGGQQSDSRYPSVTVDRRFPIVEFARLEEQSILGRGGFAYVMKARHLDWRQDVAVKCLLSCKLEGSEQDQVYSEARKLNLGSRSDHVISLLGVCLDPNLAIVMSYMENGSLAGLLRDVDVPWALRWRMAHEISLGMTFLHCQNPQILHCDLKAENVLLDGDFHVKISDFGLSKWRTKSRVVTATSPAGGTITHAPPEFFLDINVDPTAAFDVYSFGVVLWELITRKEPYGNAVANSALIRLAVTSGQRPDVTLVPTNPPDVIAVSQLMQTCWSQNPEDRPTFQECEDQLRAVSGRSSKQEILQAIINVQQRKAPRSDSDH